MEEEEIVISSWQQSDFPKDMNGSFSKMMKRSSKENIDMNALLSEPDGKTRKSSQESLDDELDNDTLSRLIEGDLKSNEEHESFNRSRKPKPKPRSPRNDTELSQPVKNSAEKLFSGRKDSADKSFSGGKKPADKLFSGAKDSADKLFSSGKVKEKNGDTVTSPRPVPRPRSKPASKEKISRENSNQGLNFLNETSESSKLSADKLFDSIGKNSKSVSFVEANRNNVSATKKNESIEKNSGNERTPPKKSPRSKQNSSSPRKGKSSDESDSEQNVQRTSEHKKRPKPQQRQRRDQGERILESNNLTVGNNSGSHWTSDGMELFGSTRMPDGSDVRQQRNFGGDDVSSGDTTRRPNQKLRDGMMSDGRVREGGTPRWESNHHDGSFRRNDGRMREEGAPRWESNDHDGSFRRNNGGLREESNDGNFSRNSGGYSRSKHEKTNEQDSFRNSHVKRGNTGDMFEEHVPASNEIVLDGEENRANQHDSRLSGKESKMRTPMKARIGLNEMTKSPDMYNFKYESRDSPQNEIFSRSKGTFSSKRSSSLTDLNNWKNTQFDDDEESLESPRSGFSSSRGIRDAVYAEWLERKQGKLKEAAKKKVEEKRKEEDKIKEKQEKELLAKKAFEAWSTKKVEVIKTEVKKKKEIKEKELDTKREKITKKQDAKKFFESWKSKKDEVLKESYKEKKAREKEVKQMKIEDHKEKIDIAKKAYDKWKSLKEEQLKEEARSARKGEKLKTKYEKEAEMEKRHECEKTFQEFLRKKGTGKRAPPSPTLTQRAWSPGGLTKVSNLIPEKVQPVIAPPSLNRSRSFSGPTRAMTSFNANKRLSRGW